MLLKLVENIENKLENCSCRYFSCKCYIKRRRSTLFENSWKAAAVDIPVVNVTLNTDTDRLGSSIVSGIITKQLTPY